jgi:hypothetical protein
MVRVTYSYLIDTVSAGLTVVFPNILTNKVTNISGHCLLGFRQTNKSTLDYAAI